MILQKNIVSMQIRFPNIFYVFSIIVTSLCFILSCQNSSLREENSSIRTTITWIVGSTIDRPMFEELVKKFEIEHPDIHIKLLWVPGVQYQAKLKTLIAAGQTPDLFYCGDVWVAYLLPFLYDITEFVKRDAEEMDWNDIYPELQKACQHNGRYYYVPYWFNISLLYYNKALFDEADVNYPTPDWTWDDYINAGIKLTKRDTKGNVISWGSNTIYGWWGEWLILVKQSGGNLFNDDITECILDSPEAIKGMQFYYDKIYKYKISPKPGYGPENDFASGKLAMDYGGHTGLWIVYNKIPGLRWDIQILPRGPKTRSGGEVAVDALGISRTTKHPEAAWEFVKFMCSKEASRRYVKEGYLVVRKSIAKEMLANRTKDYQPQNLEAVYEALKYAQPIPRSPNFIELAIDIVQPDIDLMLIKGIPAEKTCKKVTRSVNTFINTIGSGLKEK